VGVIASAVVLVLVQRFTRVHFFLYGGIGLLTCFGIGYLASRCLPATTKPLEGLTVYTTR
jgi:hypothetical protein